MSKNKRRRFSIRIFLPDGEADGLKLVEKSNWRGRGVVCPRALFPDNKGRDEFARTGVYILIGPSESGDVPTVYIGQGDPVRARLESHYAKKDFWTTAVFFVSKDENLNKAHIGYLESRLIVLAKEAKRSNSDISSLRDSLVERGILLPEGRQFRLAQDYSFNSPSQAAAVMLGRSANGRVEWKDTAGTTLKEIQERSAGSETSI